MRKRGISLVLCAALLLSLFAGCRSDNGNTPHAAIGYSEDYGIRAAVVYSGGDAWKDTLYALEQSSMLGLSVQGVEARDDTDYSDFQVLYLDDSLLETSPEAFVQDIEDYTRAGGAVFLSNGFARFFSAEYLGIHDVVKLEGCCNAPEYPACTGDEAALQTLVQDYTALYTQYADYALLCQQDYGWGVTADTAQTLVSWDGVGVYTLNRFGAGTVFLTNPMLPSAYSTGSLTMEPGEGQSTFASSTASFNGLLLCGFAEYIAKQHYGFALERVYGYYGTPSMAWELHYEEITGIANGSMQIFSELCRQYGQVPSFTLIRNSYTWFLRSESVTYLLNQEPNGWDYQMDYYESAYSAGTHVDAGGQWLTLAAVEGAGSYFTDYPEYTVRAYPQALDYNGDGFTDLVCGSSDGKIYCFEGRGFYEGRLHTAEAGTFVDMNGGEITSGGYSAPQMADLNGDGTLDLICGFADGTIRWYAGNGSDSFDEQGLLLECGVDGQVLPSLADANADGILDLAVGSDQGSLMICFGSTDDAGNTVFSLDNAVNLSGACAEAELGSWLAPAFVDWNRDGRMDVAAGVFHGYVAILLAEEDGSYAFDGYITCDELNYKGNSNLKFGNWAVPCFADLNGDGQEDLLCGSQEYGNAYPIDCGYFPYEQELREQVAYAQEHDYYLGVHYYTNSYASAQREAYELQAHLDALDYYGVETELLGVNQHTWFTSSLSGSQTMSGIYDAGLYWTSGFAAPGSAAIYPQVAPENVVALPFFLVEDGQQTTLIQNNATLSYGNSDWWAVSARYHMPICIFYHCDFAYLSEDPAHQILQTVQEFREENGYNFNREDQLMLASAAALHQSVETQGSITEEGGLTISPGTDAAGYPLYDEAVSDSLGVRVVFSEDIRAEELRVDADVWYREGNTLILGLNRPVRLIPGEGQTEQPHIRRINMAARITPTEDGAQVQFLSGGMMELAVEGSASTTSEGWTVIERDGQTIFLKFGSNESLNLIF